jgi:gamma-glutamyl-gamma-aminobutyraldehyde dehydrogenase
MGDLLSKAEYAALAKDISLPSEAFINGAFKPAISGKTRTIRRPMTF